MLGDFLSFRRMVTPWLIQLLFWIGLGISILGGVGMILAGIVMEEGAGIAFGGFALLIVGPFVVRVYCELLILAFRINETLTDIRSLLRQSSPSPQSPGTAIDDPADPSGNMVP